MKFALALLAAVVCGAHAAVSVPSDIRADSELGMSLLSKARRLEDQQQAEEEEEEEEEDAQEFSWVAGYSIKFQGCHHIQQWNDEAQDDEDVRIMTKRLVRFRLCPTSTCSDSSGWGCKSGYGDYILDMNEFLEAYFEVKRGKDEYDCQTYLYSNCNCEDDGNQGDDFDAEICEYDCFVAAGMDQCIDRNPYEDDEAQGEVFEAERYMVCEGYDPPNDDGRRRKLEDAEDEEEDEWYIGPYCAEQGGMIVLGLFKDDTCTEFADEYGGRTTFKELAGMELPYSRTSLVGSDCLSCVEQQDFDEEQNGGGDQADEDQVSEQCEQIYSNAGKCESALPYEITEDPNMNACNYMEGVKVAVRADGVIVGKPRPNPVMTAFIVIFAMAFAALIFYIWYLRTRLGVKKTALL